jgi:mono/diheme cytochrome c family protein
MMKKGILVAIVLLTSNDFLAAAAAQTVDPSIGRSLAEGQCAACHQIEAGKPSAAPSFMDISRMPSRQASFR